MPEIAGSAHTEVHFAISQDAFNVSDLGRGPPQDLSEGRTSGSDGAVIESGCQAASGKKYSGIKSRGPDAHGRGHFLRNHREILPRRAVWAIGATAFEQSAVSGTQTHSSTVSCSANAVRCSHINAPAQPGTVNPSSGFISVRVLQTCQAVSQHVMLSSSQAVRQQRRQGSKLWVQTVRRQVSILTVRRQTLHTARRPCEQNPRTLHLFSEPSVRQDDLAAYIRGWERDTAASETCPKALNCLHAQAYTPLIRTMRVL